MGGEVWSNLIMTPIALRVLGDSIEVVMEIISGTHGGGGMLEVTRNYRLLVTLPCLQTLRFACTEVFMSSSYTSDLSV